MARVAQLAHRLLPALTLTVVRCNHTHRASGATGSSRADTMSLLPAAAVQHSPSPVGFSIPPLASPSYAASSLIQSSHWHLALVTTCEG